MPEKLLEGEAESNEVNPMVTLPIGIRHGGNVYREVLIDEMTGKDEENLGDSKVGPAKFVTTLLQRTIQEIPGLLDPKENRNTLVKEKLVSGMYTPDRDKLLLYMHMITTGETTMVVEHVCDRCGTIEAHEFDLEDLDEITWDDDDKEPAIEFDLLKGYTDKEGITHKSMVMVAATGKVHTKIAGVAQTNSGKAATALIANCTKRLGDLTNIDSEIVGNLSKVDRDLISEKVLELMPGVKMFKRHTCQKCRAKQIVVVDVNSFFVSTRR